MAATDHRPVLIVIAGPNGSGKTSVTSYIDKLPDWASTIFPKE